jgi:hypothetical protein
MCFGAARILTLKVQILYLMPMDMSNKMGEEKLG